MNPLVKRVMQAFMKLNTVLYRRSGGRLMGRAGGADVLILTVIGRKSGVERTAPVAYFPYQGGYLVVGSAGGAPSTPQWFRNLASSETARVEVGAKTEQVDVRVLTEPERSEVYRDIIVTQSPQFAGYETRAAPRVVPVALLTPQ